MKTISVEYAYREGQRVMGWSGNTLGTLLLPICFSRKIDKKMKIESGFVHTFLPNNHLDDTLILIPLYLVSKTSDEIEAAVIH